MSHQFKIEETALKPQTAVLVAVISDRQDESKTKEYLDELAFLANTAQIQVLKHFTQRLPRPDSRSFLGKGKLEEVVAYATAENANMVIFDDELSSAQVRNLEKAFKIRVIDRSMLILDIFLMRAKTAQSRTQVQLAQFEYILPRLTKMWSHHSRQKGGIGMRGGPGETELETDRRIIRDRIVLLKEQLKKIEKQTSTQRKARERVARVALVGYTNVGKSTLMNLLSKSDVFAENKLFATVDATVRKITYKNIPFLLSDTVGFIRKLPTTLIESFKSTLAEIVEADVLLHVIDVSHPSFEEHMNVVSETLAEIGATNKTTILVFNKIDQYSNPDHFEELEGRPLSIHELRRMYIGKLPRAVFISAIQKENIEELRDMVLEEVSRKHYTIYPNYLE